MEFNKEEYKKQFEQLLNIGKLLNMSYKIFEDEYVKYFEDAKKESYIARYSAIKTYTERRLNEIFENATKFIAKISLILQDEV